MLLLLLLFSLVSAQNLQCHIPGECNGLYNGLTIEESYNNCLNTCKNSDTCNFFTYFEDSNICFEYLDCLPLDNVCQDCYSGQKECSPEKAICGVHGFCDGHVVAFNTTSTANECLNLCHTIDSCLWYSFFQESNVCVLTEDCPYLDESCTDCLAGERGCNLDVNYGKLFVVGGTGTTGIANYKVEVVDLVGEKSCQKITDFPLSHGSLGTFIDGGVMICGASAPYIEDCFNYNTIEDSWTLTTGKMTRPRGYAAGILLPTNEWWISGGYTGSGYTSTSEIYNPESQNFRSYINLPAELGLHIVIQVNTTNYVLLGSTSSSNKAWMLEISSERWTALPNMLRNRDTPQAGLITYPNGHKEIVVAGGSQNNSTEILDLDQLVWRYGPDLPVPLQQGVSVQFGDSFLVVGGSSSYNGNYSDSIYTFDVSLQNWVELSQKMQFGRDLFTAFLVPDDFIECV